jgi:hypothetical protein
MTLEERMSQLIEHAIPAEKNEGGNTIMARIHMQRITAPVILEDFRNGLDSMLASLFTRCLIDKGYPTQVGAMKALGDGLGQNHGGLRLHRVKRGVRRCKANVALILQAFPDDGDAIAREAGFGGGLAELLDWANELS